MKNALKKSFFGGFGCLSLQIETTFFFKMFKMKIQKFSIRGFFSLRSYFFLLTKTQWIYTGILSLTPPKNELVFFLGGGQIFLGKALKIVFLSRKNFWRFIWGMVDHIKNFGSPGHPPATVELQNVHRPAKNGPNGLVLGCEFFFFEMITSNICSTKKKLQGRIYMLCNHLRKFSCSPATFRPF